VTTLNHIVGWIAARVMSVLGLLDPLVGLAVLSLLTTVVLLLVFRASSDQRRIAVVKRSIRAALFEIRLFNDDLRAILRAQAEILRHNLTYLRLSLVPMLWVLVPLLLMMAQLQAYYGYDGIDSGRTALVTAVFDDNWRTRHPAAVPDVTLEVPTGLRLETPRVWIPSANEASWRIGANQPGDFEVIVRVADTALTKSVHVSNDLVARSTIRAGRGVLNRLLHPIEPPLPDDSVVRSISVTYPERRIRIFGHDIHWTIVFFALTLVFGLALKRRLGVVL
jgi:uncharacterized membrane protein (DUF106 family)